MPSTVVECIMNSLPWAGLHCGIFFASRLLGPMLFEHCRKLDDAGRSYWAASVVSTANCFITVYLSWKACMELNLLDVGASFTVTSPLSEMCNYAMLGYTAWDSLPLIWYRKEWGGFGMYAVHHCGTLLGWGMCSTTGIGHSFSVPMLLCEFTGPFTNGRWFLATAGLKDTTLYVANGVMMFLSFFVLRIVLNTYQFFLRFFWQRTAFAAVTPIWFQVICYPLYTVNLALQYMWFSKIYKGIMAVLFGKPEKAKKSK